MIYYRIAVHTKHAPTWRWLTTKLTPLHAVLNYLQIYRGPAYAQLRIFFASSDEALEEMLAAENRGNASFSVTPEHLLSAGQPQVLAQSAADAGLAPIRQQTLSLTANADAPNEQGTLDIPPTTGTSTTLEARRLELELGAGGDHDHPYIFTFPRALPETRAWILLMAKVQRGDLEP